MVLVIGGSGFLGPALRAAAPGRELRFTHLSHPAPGSVRFDVRSTPVVDIVPPAPAAGTAALILAGITNVDACARDPRGTSEVNVTGVIRVVDELRALGITPVFTSSDAVFDGSRAGWREADPVSPILTYGRQKREVEQYVLSLSPPGLVVRLPKLVASSYDPRCMVSSWIDALGKPGRVLCAIDNYFTPADSLDVAAAILRLIDANARGLFHLGGGERIGRRDLLRAVEAEYRAFAVPRAEIVECSLRDVPVLEPRPLDTSMDSSKYAALAGRPLRPASDIARLAVRSRFGKARA